MAASSSRASPASRRIFAIAPRNVAKTSPERSRRSTWRLKPGSGTSSGRSSRKMTGDEVLDLTYGPSAGGFEPLLLGRRGRDASQLTREGEADGTGLEVASSFGELFEGFGDAELFLSEAGAVAE